MSGKPINAVKEQSRAFVTKYFKTRKSKKPPHLIFFNDNFKAIKEDTLEACLKKIDVHCKAEGGTLFPKPMQYLLKLVQENDLQELFVLFMTDGLDNVPHETRGISKALKELLLKKEVYSKFSVIGIGQEH